MTMNNVQKNDTAGALLLYEQAAGEIAGLIWSQASSRPKFPAPFNPAAEQTV